MPAKALQTRAESNDRSIDSALTRLDAAPDHAYPSKFMAAEPIPHDWNRILSRTRRRVNAAIWMARFLPDFGILLLAAAVLLIALRALHLSVVAFAPALLAATLFVGWNAWRRIQQDRWTPRDALLRIETARRWNSRLSASAEGAIGWPAVPADSGSTDDGLRWRLAPALVRPGLAALLLGAATVFPVRPPADFATPPPTAEVPALKSAADWIETVAETEVADPEALEKFREELDELRARPPEERFSHASLEAADSLRDRLGQAIGAFAGGLQNADRALEDASAAMAGPSPQPIEPAATALQAALEGLRTGTLPISGKLGERLAELARNNTLQSLNPSEISALQASLRRGVDGASKCLGPMSPGGDGQSMMPGNGGINRGPGEAPLALGPAAPPLESDTLAPLSGADPSRASLGDTVRTETVAPDAETSPDVPPSAGSWNTQARGAAATSQAAWLPAESEALKRFYR